MKTYIQKLVLLILIVTIIGCQELFDIDPLDKANVITNRIMKETVVGTEKSEIKPLSDIQVIDFDLVLGNNIKGICFARNAIISSVDTMIELGTSSDIPFSIKVNSEICHIITKKREFVFSEEAYNLFSFQDTFKVKLKKGSNPIIVSGLVEDSGQIYLRQIASYEGKPTIKFGSASEILPWKFIRGATNSIKNISELLIKSTVESLKGEWIPQPNLFYDKLIIDDDNTYKRESYYEWHYAIGTTMLGLINLSKISNNSEIYNFIKGYCDFAISMRDTFRYQYKELHALRTGNYRMFRKTMLDDTGPASLPFVEVYQKENDKQYLEIIKEMTDYVANEQVRLEDGTFCRPEPEEMTIWADDLFMSSQLLLRAAKIFDKPEYIDDVVHQIIKFHEYLWDPEKKIHRHAYFDFEKKQSDILWSRANGWMSWSISSALLHIPKTHKDYNKVLKIYKTIIDGLVEYQGKNGLWHQVLDRTDSFEETSGSAMFTLAIARGVINGWLSEDYKKYATKGWEGISRNISDDGVVKDICRGTGIGYDYDFYNNRDRFDNDPRGLGAVLTAALEVSKICN